MVRYPVSTKRDYSSARTRGAPAKRQEYNRVAQLVEDFINADLSDEPDGVYSFSTQEIARALREDADLVHRAVFGLDAGHNGVTVVKGDAPELRR